MPAVHPGRVGQARLFGSEDSEKGGYFDSLDREESASADTADRTDIASIDPGATLDRTNPEQIRKVARPVPVPREVIVATLRRTGGNVKEGATLSLKIADNVKIEVDKTAIATIAKEPAKAA